MKPRTLLLLAASLAALAVHAGESSRFSQSLTTEQRTVTGVERLDSNQVAALDALVRLNLTQAAADAQKAERAKNASEATAALIAQPVAFSRSLSSDQRRAAGLDALTPEQQAQIDTLVAARTPGTPHYEPAAPKQVEAVQFFPNRFEMHGEVGFSLGVGSGGYSSKEAWVTSTLLDTKTGTQLSVTVAAGTEKWKRPFGFRNDWEDVTFSLGAPLFGHR